MNRAEPTVVGHSTWLHVFLWTALPAGGAALGFLVAQLPGWIAALPWAPNQEQVAELADVVGLKVTVALAVVGVLAGGLLALMSYDDMVTITVDDASLELRRGEVSTKAEVADITGVFVDGKEVVVRGASGAELMREQTDHSAAKIRAAVETHGHPWFDTDPHDREFERWVDGVPAIGEHANAVLRARQVALDSGEAGDARELRAEVARLGIVVRDRDGRQYWRRSGTPNA